MKSMQLMDLCKYCPYAINESFCLFVCLFVCSFGCLFVIVIVAHFFCNG